MAKDKKKLEQLLDIMYNMFSYNTIPHLQIEDFKIMWEVLLEKYGIKIAKTKWEEFILSLQAKNSNKYSTFKKLFTKYFY